MDIELIQLIEKAIEQIKVDVANEDYTAIEELLVFVPKDKLEGFLQETI